MSKTRRAYTRAELTRIKALVNEGKSDQAIARMFNRTKLAAAAVRRKLFNPDTYGAIVAMEDQNGRGPGRLNKTVAPAFVNAAQKNAGTDNEALTSLVLGSTLTKRQKLTFLEAIL